MKAFACMGACPGARPTEAEHVREKQPVPRQDRAGGILISAASGIEIRK